VGQPGLFDLNPRYEGLDEKCGPLVAAIRGDRPLHPLCKVPALRISVFDGLRRRQFPHARSHLSMRRHAGCERTALLPIIIKGVNAFSQP
jgi:hypothetical protein